MIYLAPFYTKEFHPYAFNQDWKSYIKFISVRYTILIYKSQIAY